jgi:hypothetical protein
MTSEQPTVPSYLESRKYMQGFASNGNKDFKPNYLPSGQEDQSVIGLELKYRKKKDYEITCEVEVNYAETKFEDASLELPPFPARCWACKMHDHVRFAALIPIKMKMIALPSAMQEDVQKAMDRCFEESVEKLNAWWNQKETEHLRTRYVGSLFIYNPSKFKVVSESTNKVWNKEDGKPLGTFLHENGGTTPGTSDTTKSMCVKYTVRILRPASDRRCSIQ